MRIIFLLVHVFNLFGVLYLQNVLENVYDLSKENVVLSATIDECKLENEESKTIVQRFARSTRTQVRNMILTPELGKDISVWWNDSGIRVTFERINRNKGQYMDNIPYFFERIGAISKEPYRATWEDYVCYNI